MKAYGQYKATEFTKKQINVIYGMAKRQELKVEKWVISDFYNLADFYSQDFNGSAAYAEAQILRILDDVFAGNKEAAQKKIDDYTEQHFDLMGLKAKKNANRNFVA